MQIDFETAKKNPQRKKKVVKQRRRHGKEMTSTIPKVVSMVECCVAPNTNHLLFFLNTTPSLSTNIALFLSRMTSDKYS